MDATWVWFGLMALALIGEVLSGTFYLLMVAAGMAAAGAAAWFGFALPWQFAVCGGVMLVVTWVLRRTGVLRKRGHAPSRNADLNMDIGRSVKVDGWLPDGTTRVWYRGAHWEAQRAPGTVPAPGQHVIVEMRGSTLVLAPQADSPVSPDKDNS